MQKFVAATFVLVIATAGVSAEEFVGFVTKFEDGTMTFKKSDGIEPDKDVVLKHDDNLKIVRGKVNPDTMKVEDGDAYEGGKEAFAKQVKETAERVKKWTEEGKKGFGPGVFARIVTEGDKVTHIRVAGGAKKKPAK